MYDLNSHNMTDQAIVEMADRYFQIQAELHSSYRDDISVIISNFRKWKMDTWHYFRALDSMVTLVKHLMPTGDRDVAIKSVLGQMYKFAFAYSEIARNDGFYPRPVFEDIFYSVYTGKLHALIAEDLMREGWIREEEKFLPFI